LHGLRKQKTGTRYLWVHHHNHNQPTQDIPPPRQTHTRRTPVTRHQAPPRHPHTHHPGTQPRQPRQQARPGKPRTFHCSQASSSQQPARPYVNHSRSNQLLINQLLHNVIRLASQHIFPGLFALLIQPASLLIKAVIRASQPARHSQQASK